MPQKPLRLITEVNENITVAKSPSKGYFIEGIFLQAALKNRNGRIYPMEVMEPEVTRYVNEYVKHNRAFGELNHPDSPSINLDRVSHIIKELRKEGTNFIGKAKIMTETPMGKIVKSLMDEEAKLGVSSRGMGSLSEEADGTQVVQDDFQLNTAADIVADPSAPQAFVRGVMEGREWVWNNGILVERQVAKYKRIVEKDFRDTDKMVEAFSRFLSELSRKH
jgi:hypothetical protein